MLEYMRVVAVREYGGEVLGPIVLSIIRQFVQLTAHRFIDAELLEELRGIADVTAVSGFGLTDLILLNIGYDLIARCTAAVIQVKMQSARIKPVLVRGMDWDCACFTGRVVDVTVVRAGRPLAIMSVWPGIIGALTGIRLPSAHTPRDGYVFAINYRQLNDSLLTNVVFAIVHGALPVSLLCRRVLLTDRLYDDAKQHLLTSPIMSPTYVTLVGPHTDDGAIITRDRSQQRSAAVAIEEIKNARTINATQSSCKSARANEL